MKRLKSYLKHLRSVWTWTSAYKQVNRALGYKVTWRQAIAHAVRMERSQINLKTLGFSKADLHRIYWNLWDILEAQYFTHCSKYFRAASIFLAHGISIDDALAVVKEIHLYHAGPPVVHKAKKMIKAYNQDGYIQTHEKKVKAWTKH